MANANKVEKNIFSNGKLYLTKKLKDVLQVDVDDLVGVYIDGKNVVIEKYTGTCLHCKEEQVDKPNNKGLCFMCRQHPTDKLAIAEKRYLLVKVPKSKFLNIPEVIRNAKGYAVEKDEDGKILNSKHTVTISMHPYKKQIIIKESTASQKEKAE